MAISISNLGRLLAMAPLALASAAAQSKTTEPPLSFEVASLKVASKPIATKDDYTAGFNAGMRAALASQGLRISGRNVRITDNTLRDLIRLAYQVKDYQISGPGWMGEDKFEIVATMPEGATRAQAPAMLRTLLEQRFQLKIRRETRKMAGLALVVADAKEGAHLAPPKATRADQGMVNAEAGVVRTFAATLSGFADMLAKAVGRPVVDATGIEGLYTFDLTYAPDGSAADSAEKPALATALRQQFGLKLEKREIPLEILLVEQVNRAFAEN